MALKTDTIGDATIINAPNSMKKRDKQRDPEMHQTRKRQQWYFGMKLLSAWIAKRSGAQSRGDAGQRARQVPSAAVAARTGEARVWRQRLLQSKETNPLQGAAGEGIYE